MAVGSILLLAGAGCSQPAAETTLPTDQTGEVTTPPVAETQPAPEQTTTGEMKLSAEALGGNRVKLSWEFPTGMEEPGSFRLVRGPNEDPALPRSYYFQVNGSKREMTWVGIAPGKQYFRICTYVNNECTQYSNNVEVEVK